MSHKTMDYLVVSIGIQRFKVRGDKAKVVGYLIYFKEHFLLVDLVLAYLEDHCRNQGAYEDSWVREIKT